MGLFGIVAILIATLFAGWLIEQFRPSEKLRPTTNRGAAFIILQSMSYMSLVLYYSYYSLSHGYIKCIPARYRDCGVNLLDANGVFHSSHENFVSLAITPFAFWRSYLYICLVTLILAYWLFGTIRWLILQHGSANTQSKRARGKSRAT